MSSTEKYIELLRLQATTTEDPQAARDAMNTLQLYGYKAVPVLRDVLETCDNTELKDLAAELLRKLGWNYPSSSDDEKETSP